MKNHFWLYGILLFSFLGALDAGYLTYIALSGNPLTCNFLEGCQTVTGSPYSRILGIPLSLFGFFFYLVAFGLGAWMLRTPTPLLKRFLLLVSVFGIMASAYFVYLQALVIKAWCEYCLFSATTSTLLFIFAIVYAVRSTNKTTPPPVSP